MVIPKSYSFYWAFMLSVIFFTFSDEDGILPIKYVYVMFVLTAFFVAPFLLRRRVDRRVLWAAFMLLVLGTLSSYGSGVPSAFLYSIGPILVLITASNPAIFKTERHRDLSIKWTCGILLTCSAIAIPFMEPNYHNRFFLSYVGNPNYTAMLYLTVFIFVQVAIPALQYSWRIFLSSASYLMIFLAIYLTETRSVTLALIIYLLFRIGIALRHYKKVRFVLIGLVVFTVIGQLLAYYIFVAVDIGATERNAFSLFDASNMTRVNAFYNSFIIAMSDPFFIWHGVGNVDGIWEILAASGEVEHVPHNWFMMMWLSNGALFTLLVFSVLIIGAKQLSLNALPGYAALLVVSLIMGRAALFAPLCLFLVGCLFRNSPKLPKASAAKD